MFWPIIVVVVVASIGWYGVVLDEDFDLMKWVIGIKDNLLKWIKKEMSRYK